MIDLPASLERLAKRLRDEQADAELHAAEWSGAGFPNRSPGLESPVKTGNVSDPTRDAGLRALSRLNPRSASAVVEASRTLPAYLKALEAAVEHVERSLSILKVVLPTEAYCVRCGGVTERPHFHDGEPHCQGCHDAGEWRRDYQRDYMRDYRRGDGGDAA